MVLPYPFLKIIKFFAHSITLYLLLQIEFDYGKFPQNPTLVSVDIKDRLGYNINRKGSKGEENVYNIPSVKIVAFYN